MSTKIHFLMIERKKNAKRVFPKTHSNTHFCYQKSYQILANDIHRSSKLDNEQIRHTSFSIQSPELHSNVSWLRKSTKSAPPTVVPARMMGEYPQKPKIIVVENGVIFLICIKWQFLEHRIKWLKTNFPLRFSYVNPKHFPREFQILIEF